MQKRSHKLLASTLLECEHGFGAKRFEWAFLLGSFQPDCNPLTYLKGSLRAYKLRGHNFSNSQIYINAHIRRLQRRARWNVWHYYTLGKLTHYLADAFTYPHNEIYSDTIWEHRHYEDSLRLYLAEYISRRRPFLAGSCQDLPTALDRLHRQYLKNRSDMAQDVQYILESTGMLMAGCLPKAC